MKLLAPFLCLFSACFASLPEALLAKFAIPSGLSEMELLQTVQRLWFQPQKERWEFDRRNEEMRSELIPIFEEMGYLKEVAPSQNHYNYALIHGATLWSVQKRVAFLEKCLERGMRVDKIVFLLGTRALRADEQELLGPGYTDESELGQWVYERSSLPRKIPVSFVQGPPNGPLGRSKASDALIAWLHTESATGTCLGITDQPYVPYHYAAARRYLPSIETVGPEARDNWSVALILDCIARTLFEQSY